MAEGYERLEKWERVMRRMICAVLASTLALASCTRAQERDAAFTGQPVAAAVVSARTSPETRQASAEDRRLYRDAATAAWRFLDGNYQAETGLVNATPDWHFTTIWDVGAQLIAFQAAKELGLLPEPEYHARTQRTLNTLEKLELFRGAAYNKLYNTKTGALGGSGRDGWSATDLGRLLVGLRIVSVHEPRYAAQAERIAKRMDYGQLVKDGYIYGQMIGSTGKPWSFQEGRIGYEQYVAKGFALWGARAVKALDHRTNAQRVEVLGVPLLADKRKLDRLTSEPFVLMGLELGFENGFGELASNVLRAQEARYRQTGVVTIVSEDAVAVKPAYFYYYCVYCNGKPFVIDISQPGNERTDPRWVSTKAALGWHALMPSEYTKLAVERVAPAITAKGVASGVYEKSGESTATYDINTAAVVLETAWYVARGGKPLIAP